MIDRNQAIVDALIRQRNQALEALVLTEVEVLVLREQVGLLEEKADTLANSLVAVREEADQLNSAKVSRKAK